MSDYKERDMRIRATYGGNKVDFCASYRFMTDRQDNCGLPLIFQYLQFKGTNTNDNITAQGGLIKKVINYAKDKEQETPDYENGGQKIVLPQHAVIISTPVSHKVIDHLYRVFTFYEDNLPGQVTINASGEEIMIIDDKIFKFDSNTYVTPTTQALVGFVNGSDKLRVLKDSDGLNLEGLSLGDYLSGDSVESHIQAEIKFNYDRFLEAYFENKDFKNKPVPTSSSQAAKGHDEKLESLEQAFKRARNRFTSPIDIPIDEFPNVTTSVTHQKGINLRSKNDD